MHTCAAKCYSDRKSPIEDVERCAQNCNAKLQEASSFVQREIEGFQVSDRKFPSLPYFILTASGILTNHEWTCELMTPDIVRMIVLVSGLYSVTYTKPPLFSFSHNTNKLHTYS